MKFNMMKQRWLLYGLMAILGIAHAQTFSIWPSGGLQILVLSLAWAVVATVRPEQRPARQMFVFALAWMVSGLYWLHFSMHDIGGLPTVLSGLAIIGLSCYLASYYAVAAWLWRRFFTQRKISDYLVALPLLWLGAELARGYVFGGFPWLMTGYAQVENLLLKGFFALLGAYGVSFVAAAISGGLAWLWVSLRAKPDLLNARNLTVTGLSTAVVLVIGLVVQGIDWGKPFNAPVSLRVFQPNVAQTIKFDSQEIEKTTSYVFNTAIKSDAQLSVYPETVLPYPWQKVPENALQALQTSLIQSEQAGQPRAVLLGSVGMDGARYFNSGLWLDASQDIANPVRYDKIHLLPFGEMIPWGFQWFVDAMNIPLGGYGYGQSRTPFNLQTDDGSVKVAANICYENVFGEELALWHRVDSAPNIWVNLTNLGWFGDARTSPAHVQFLGMSQARAMELARPMILATNTGISAYIKPDGVIAEELPAQQQTVGNWNVQAYQGSTPYVMWRNIPLFALLGIFIVWLLVSNFKRRGSDRFVIQTDL